MCGRVEGGGRSCGAHSCNPTPVSHCSATLHGAIAERGGGASLKRKPSRNAWQEPFHVAHSSRVLRTTTLTLSLSRLSVDVHSLDILAMAQVGRYRFLTIAVVFHLIYIYRFVPRCSELMVANKVYVASSPFTL